MKSVDLATTPGVSIVFYLGTMLVAVFLTAIITTFLVSQKRAR